MVPRSGVKNMGGEGEKTTLSLNRDNRAIKERSNGGITRERNLEGSVGILGLPTAEETTYIAIAFGEEIENIKAAEAREPGGHRMRLRYFFFPAPEGGGKTRLGGALRREEQRLSRPGMC
jgi:hypothetical protein